MSDEYINVSVGNKGVIHIAVSDASKTLCGLRWWAENYHGDTYCKNCQYILSVRENKKMEKAERQAK